MIHITREEAIALAKEAGFQHVALAMRPELFERLYNLAIAKSRLAEGKQEPVLYQRRMKPDYGPHWTAWDDCSEATFKQILIVPKLHDWTHEARALYAAPQGAPK